MGPPGYLSLLCRSGRIDASAGGGVIVSAVWQRGLLEQAMLPRRRYGGTTPLADDV